MKYISNPFFVDAFQWTGGKDQTEDPEWVVSGIKLGYIYFINTGTPEVQMVICKDGDILLIDRYDYVVQDFFGSITHEKPEIFEKKYELVEYEGIFDYCKKIYCKIRKMWYN